LRKPASDLLLNTFNAIKALDRYSNDFLRIEEHSSKIRQHFEYHTTKLVNVYDIYTKMKEIHASQISLFSKISNLERLDNAIISEELLTLHKTSSDLVDLLQSTNGYYVERLDSFLSKIVEKVDNLDPRVMGSIDENVSFEQKSAFIQSIITPDFLRSIVIHAVRDSKLIGKPKGQKNFESWLTGLDTVDWEALKSKFILELMET
jgi:hypothetical protein